MLGSIRAAAAGKELRNPGQARGRMPVPPAISAAARAWRRYAILLTGGDERWRRRAYPGLPARGPVRPRGLVPPAPGRLGGELGAGGDVQLGEHMREVTLLGCGGTGLAGIGQLADMHR